ncbi:MAG TPA: PAS domain-containing protein, partial [Candidatus Acidoferrum sp.]|nr:PAS domain-containing protein [Candidatus Acidoferrum sp.]
MPASGRGNSLELALEVSELRYRRLFETAQDGILILDADSGKIIDVNPFLLDLLDYPFESIIGLQLWEIGLFEDIAANQAAFEKLQTEEYIRYENHPLRT